MGTESEKAVLPSGVDQPCLYCGGTEFRLLYAGVCDRLGHVPGTREFWQCQSCKSAQLVPMPSASQLASYYPKTYSFSLAMGKEGGLRRFLNKIEYTVFFRPIYQAQVRQTLRGIEWDGQSTGTILDIGCGGGLRLIEFRRLGFAVHGFDLQEEVVNQLRTTHGIPATAGELTNLGNFFASSSFDLITAYHVVEHVSDVQRVLSVIWNLLRPGGWFAGAVPLLDSNQARWFGKHWAGVQEAPRHLSLPSKLGMTACCQLVGFEGVHFRPDSSLNCAGVVGASLFPGASLTRVYARGTLVPLLLRFLGGMATAISLPWCWIENRMSNSMALGIVFGRKPS